MKYLFLINPVAGKCKGKSYIPEIHRYFKDKPSPYYVEITEYPGHATLLASQYASKDDYRIIAFGGDGTLNEALNGMAGTGSTLGIIPTGSGNDFIKSVVPDRDYTDILRRTIEGEEIRVDCGKVQNKYFINIMSVGIDSEIAHYAAAINRKIYFPGKMSYLLGLGAAIIKKKTRFTLKITIDGERVVENHFLLIAVTNGKYYGGGFIPVPHTRYDDHLFDICHVEEKGVFFILRVLPKYMKGTHGNIKGVQFDKGTQISIESPKPLKINLDGEVIVSNTVDIRLLPHHIRFIRPI